MATSTHNIRLTPADLERLDAFRARVSTPLADVPLSTAIVALARVALSMVENLDADTLVGEMRQAQGGH